MAMHNPGSRTFLAIVLAGIVIAFLIAMYFMQGGKSDTSTKVDEPAAPVAEQAADGVTPPDEMPDGVTPPDEMLDDPLPDDGVTPPDEMLDEPMPDEAPDAMTPAENPEESVPENPPPAAPNP